MAKKNTAAKAAATRKPAAKSAARRKSAAKSPPARKPTAKKRTDKTARSAKKAAPNKPAKVKAAPSTAKRKPPRSPAAPKKPRSKVPATTPAPTTRTAPRADRDAAGPTLYALVIGCDFYQPNRTPEGFYPSLNGCVRDAEQVEQFLRARAGLTDDRLTKLTSSDDGAGDPLEPPERLPTYENIVNAFRALTARAQPNDHVYIHYSGHGSQCPTIVPAVKGRDGLDEGLVPIDIGKPTARYVRDVEIAVLLRELTDKQLTVTVVFDSCHSGGATRAAVRGEPGVAVRGGLFVDRTQRPASLVGTPAQLAAVLAPAAAGARAPSATRGMAATAQASGCAVLAACRPDELAREASFDGFHAQGALTYWYLNSVTNCPAELTFRVVYNTVLARIHGRFPQQTAVFIGDLDRPILGGVAVAAAAAIPVDAVSADAKNLTLRAGQASLLRPGIDLAIYAPETNDLTDTKARLAVARVTSVDAATSAAEVTASLGRKVQVGDRAVPIGVPQQLVRSVRTAVPDTHPPAATDALQRVEAALKGATWLEAAAPDRAADFVVTTTPDGKTYQICDAAAVPMSIRPELATADPDAAKSVVARLVHLARFQAVRGLDNTDAFSRLYGKLRVELRAPPAGYQNGDALPHDLQPLPTDRPVRLKVDDWVVLGVTNTSADTLNVVLLDLGPDWAVSLVEDGETFHPLRPGEQWQLALRAALPDGVQQGKDVLKVIATIDPPPAYELLTLPRLDRPIPSAAERGATRAATRGTVGGAGPANPLDALLAAASADRPTRALSAARQPTRGWTVAHAEVEIRR
jgi:hypothetical protein